VLPEVDEQSVGFIALRRGNQLRVLREVVLTKIYDWKGRASERLFSGFRSRKFNLASADQTFPIKSGIWLNQKLYIDGLGASDRHLIAQRIGDMMTRSREGRGWGRSRNRPTSFVLQAASTREPNLHQPIKFAFILWRHLCAKNRHCAGESLRSVCWCCFRVSQSVCSWPEDFRSPSTGSLPVRSQNLAKRKEAEENLVEVNRDLKKALADLKSTPATGDPTGTLERDWADGERNRARFQQYAHADPGLCRSASHE